MATRWAKRQLRDGDVWGGNGLEYRRIIGVLGGKVRYESQGVYRTVKEATFQRWITRTKLTRVNPGAQA